MGPNPERQRPTLSVDMIEDRFRFTTTVTATSEALRQMQAAQDPWYLPYDTFGHMVMKRAHVTEQAGLIRHRRILLGKRREGGLYREPIRFTLD